MEYNNTIPRNYRSSRRSGCNESVAKITLGANKGMLSFLQWSKGLRGLFVRLLNFTKKNVKDSMLKIGSQPTNTFCISVFCMPAAFFHFKSRQNYSKKCIPFRLRLFLFSTTVVLFLVQLSLESDSSWAASWLKLCPKTASCASKALHTHGIWVACSNKK